MALADDPQ